MKKNKLRENMLKSKSLIVLIFVIHLTSCDSIKNRTLNNESVSIETTQVTISFPEKPELIDPMIYGQMLEDCNDKVIYDGIVNTDGSERAHVTELLRPLQMPIVRWPAGTFIHEYRWERGIGPFDKRPTVDDHTWKGKETHLFGTDEFLAWCKKLNTVPYINLNMGNDPEFGGTLQEAMNWIEYTNGSINTPYGQKRAQNGHVEPYGVKYWCIGNENYASWGKHTAETADVYSKKLFEWSSAIREENPDLKLLAVGYTIGWNDSILNKTGKLIDFLTQHYYITSYVKDGILQNPDNSIFAPVFVERHLAGIGELLKKVNHDLDRDNNPIRLSVDEWNNRHNVFEDGKYNFTRKPPRRQFDVAIAAQMLNIFIRQSPTVGMANYIFPVNGHGLIKTIGNNDAYLTPSYFVFEQYRKWMIGTKLQTEVNGPGILSSKIKPSMSGDAKEIKPDEQTLSYIDVSAAMSPAGEINIALVNRSSTDNHAVKIELPEKYFIKKKWELSYSDINAANTPEERTKITPKITDLKGSKKDFHLIVPPCGLIMLQCSK